MRPGRELDTRIAQEVFGHKVWARAKILMEDPASGERPLRQYSKSMEWAWEVAEKMQITLIPIEGGQWFAFVGPRDKMGWDSPQSVLEFLAGGNFNDCGADVGDNVALVICQAALKAIDKRKSMNLNPSPDIFAGSPAHESDYANLQEATEASDEVPDSLKNAELH